MKRLLTIIVIALIVAVAYYLSSNNECDRYTSKPITEAPIECIERYLKGMKP